MTLQVIGAGVLTKQVELLAMEEHLSVFLSQHGAEPWLRLCVVSER
jgi:hypothetical protein